MKLFESEKTLAFLDIQPLSDGHAVSTSTQSKPLTIFRPSPPPCHQLTHTQLVIPKYHGAKLTDIPDDSLAEILSVAKRIAKASGATDYNILQNNGRIAHQMVDHVHFHMIPKPNQEQGLGVGWPMREVEKSELQKVCFGFGFSMWFCGVLTMGWVDLRGDQVEDVSLLRAAVISPLLQKRICKMKTCNSTISKVFNFTLRAVIGGISCSIGSS